VLVDLAVMAFFVCLRNRSRVVLLSQEDDCSYYKEGFLRSFVTFAYKVIFWLKIPVLCVSDSLATRLGKMGASRVMSVSNGIEQKLFSRQLSSSYSKEKSSAVAIIMYARRDYRKGMDIAVEAIEKLYSFKPEGWELWVIGEERPDIQAPSLKVKVYGVLNEEELIQCLSGGDVFLSSSRQEGFGLMQLQAMACGCALVTTDAFCLAKHETNALVSQVNDSSGLALSLERLIKDNELRIRLVASGIELAQSYPKVKGDQLFQEALLEIYSDHSAVS
jgi:glycosyltransferase involved in cell wall biosynthesis